MFDIFSQMLDIALLPFNNIYLANVSLSSYFLSFVCIRIVCSVVVISIPHFGGGGSHES